MEFPENFIKKIEMYTNQPWFNDVCESLNIYTSDIPDDEKIKQISGIKKMQTMSSQTAYFCSKNKRKSKLVKT